jgi:cytochrome P450
MKGDLKELPVAADYDLFDPLQVDGHDTVLARLRRESPISECAPGLLYVARYQDILEVCRKPEIYRQGRHIPAHQDTRSKDELNLGETDPPEHSQIRKVLAALLTPAKVRAMEPEIRRICARMVAAFEHQGRAELIADLAGPLPGAVIGSMTGLPDYLHAQFRPYTDAFMTRTDSDPVKVARAGAIVGEFDTQVREIIRARLASTERPSDFLTGLIESVDERGAHLSEDKILTHLTKDIVVGGTETTKHLLGNLFYNLCSTANAYERVRVDRSLVPVAVEETLRATPPVQVMFRVAAADTSIGGHPVAAGSTLALGYASGGRDEDHFEAADDFSLERRNYARNPHLGFGHGIHFCVGAALARLEAHSALNAVLDRLSHMRLAPGFRYERVRFFVMKGPERLNVEFDQA